MEKVIRDGKVAVLYSPGFGAGWYSWSDDHKELLFHPKLVEMVENKQNTEERATAILAEIGLPLIYCGGVEDLKISWLPVGTAFEINEYDGSENIRTLDHLNLIA